MKNKFYIIIIPAMLIIQFFLSDIYANGMNRNMPVSGFGVTADYAYSKEMHDGGLYISYRNGVFHLLSFYFNADAGYRFNEESVNTKIGGGLLFLFVGLETGFTMSFNIEDKDNLYARVCISGFQAGCLLMIMHFFYQ